MRMLSCRLKMKYLFQYILSVFTKGFLINMYLVYLVREPIQGSCSNYLNKHDVQTSKPHLPRRPISILIVVVGSGFFKF